MARTVPAPSWVLCSQCRSIVYRTRWERAVGVCPECGWHARLSAPQRLEQLLDPGTGRLLEFVTPDQDFLGFVDTMPYATRLAAARRGTGLDEAVLCARGEIGGHRLVTAVMDFAFLGGSLGSAAGERITRAAETALAERIPLLLVVASGGARMQEGALSLMQMAKTSAALGRLDEAGVLTVCLVTDPTFGGVAASFATLADVILAEPGARLGFAGRRVIEQTIRQRLPPEFQTAEFLHRRGFVDRVTPRSQLRAELARLLAHAEPAADTPIAPIAADPADPGLRDPGLLPEQDPWKQVRAARTLDRLTTLDYLSLVFDDFVELSGDRVGGDCPAMVAGLAQLDGVPVVVVGQQKGHTPAELAGRNYGMAAPAGYRKAARMMRLAAKLGLPVITFIDTPGAHPGAEAEEHGQAVAIAENLRLMAALPVPLVSVVTGEGGSGGALGIGVANRVLILANAVYSVISAEGCASILWQDPAAAPKAAAALGLVPRDLLRLGVVDAVLPEPAGGTGADPLLAAGILRAGLRHELAALAGLGSAALIEDRRARYRRFGAGADDVPQVSELEKAL
jgi:acetyl-CoA carboxylase carboxyl transferase beta subunit/acetyl-CoA carboxylase carboxyl transferase alpha subunit